MIAKILSFVLGLEAGKDIFFLMMFGHSEIVSSKIPRIFMYFSNFRGSLMSNFENVKNT